MVGLDIFLILLGMAAVIWHWGKRCNEQRLVFNFLFVACFWVAFGWLVSFGVNKW